MSPRAVSSPSRPTATRFPSAWPASNVEVLTDGICHSGELISRHSRIEGAYWSSIDKSHYWGLYKPAKPTAAPADEVEVRDLAVYEQLLEGGVL